MLYIDSEKVDFKNDKEDYKFRDTVLEYRKVIAAFKEKHGKVILYETPKPEIDKETGNRRPYKGYSWQSKAVVADISGQSGEQVWIYAKISAPKKNGIVEHTENIQVSRGSMYIDLEADPDFAYFLTKHRSVQRGILKLYDPKALNRGIAKERIQSAQFHALVYSPDSILFENETKMRMIAKKWGLSHVDSKDPDEVRNTLYDIVMNNEDAKKKDHSIPGIKEFMDDFNLEDDVKIGAEIQTAIDRKILYLDRATSEWMLIVDAAQMPVALMKVPDSAVAKARLTLHDYLRANTYDLDLISKVLKGSVKVQHGKITDKTGDEIDVNRILTKPEEVDECDNWATIQKNAKHYECYRVGMSKVEAKEKIKEKILKEAV